MAATADIPTDIPTLPPRAGDGRPPDDLPPADRGDWGGDDDEGNPGDRRHAKWVTLAAFLHPAEAHIARLRLESADIPCVLLDEFAAATNCLSIAVGGVKLQVRAGDRERAAIVLRRLRGDADVVVARLPDAGRCAMAACAVEAAGVACRSEGRELRVRHDDLPAAAGAVARTPFAAALSPAGIESLAAQPCPACESPASRVDPAAWRVARRRRTRRPDLQLGPWHRRVLIPLLASRRCLSCGTRW